MRLRLLFAGSALTAALLGTTTAFAGTTATKSTAKSASTTATHHAWNKNGTYARGSRGGGFFSDIPQILGISQASFSTDLKSGKTIAQIAESKGVSQETLITKLTAEQKTQLDAAVKARKMTSAQEQQRLANLPKMLTAMINQKGGMHRGGSHGAWSKSQN